MFGRICLDLALLYLRPFLHWERILHSVLREENCEELKPRSDGSVLLTVRALGDIIPNPYDVIEHVLALDLVKVSLAARIAELFDGSRIPVDGRRGFAERPLVLDADIALPEKLKEADANQLFEQSKLVRVMRVKGRAVQRGGLGDVLDRYVVKAFLFQQPAQSVLQEVARPADATSLRPTLLKIDSSPMGERSVSRKLTAEFANAWLKAHPGGTIISRDLNTLNIPVVNGAWVAAAYTPENARRAEQKDALAVSELLIAELQNADEYVIGVPMHNFSIPSTLKLCIDQVVRMGKTFRYSAAGREGLLKGKKATLVMASGGVYDQGSATESLNFVTPYLRTIFEFIGITDVKLHRCRRDPKIDDRRSRFANFPGVFAGESARTGQSVRKKNSRTGDADEDRIDNRAVFTGPDFSRVWLERIPALHSHATSQGASGTVWRRDLRFSLLGGCLRHPGSWRLAAFGKPVVVLALVLLGPITVNIFFFHALMDPGGIPLAVVVVVLWLFLAVRYKQYFAGIFVQRAA